jgi:hypothetical protein
MVSWLSILLAGLMGTGVMASALMFARLALRQLKYAVLYDDSWFLTLRDSHNPLAWIFSQHNEHRIVLAKLSTLIETDILGLSITSSLTLQSFLLVALSSGIIAILCRKVLLSRWNQLLTWLACTLILTNPWQWMTFAWEFQTPWFLINTLVLATTLLLISFRRSQHKRSRRLILISIAIIPWLAIFNNGSGFALAAALCFTTLLLSRQAFLVALASSAIASISYFFLLDYSRPWAQHHRYAFDPDFFLRVLFGGPWQGLAILVLMLSLFLIRELSSHNAPRPTQEVIPAAPGSPKTSKLNTALALCTPAIFSISFCLMTTLSRSTVSINYADYSYYVTHSLMLAISLILLAGLVNERNACQLHGKSIPSVELIWLYPSIVVVFTTMLSFPQVITRNAPSFRQAWANANIHRERAQATVICFAARNSRATQPAKRSAKPCVGTDAERNAKVIDAYFQGRNPVAPIGWHKTLIDAETDPQKDTRSK